MVDGLVGRKRGAQSNNFQQKLSTTTSKNEANKEPNKEPNVNPTNEQTDV